MSKTSSDSYSSNKLALMLVAFFIGLAVVFSPHFAEAGSDEIEEALALLARGERHLDLQSLSAAEKILLAECLGANREANCEFYLARTYFAMYLYWSTIKKDSVKADAFLEQARIKGEEAKTRRPLDAEAHVLLGQIYQVILNKNYVLGITQAALAESPVAVEFNKALELDPQNGEAEMGLGIYYHFLPRFIGGDPHRARGHFKNAAKYLPTNPEPLVWISRSYREQGRLKKARIYIDRALVLAPGNVSVQIEDKRLRQEESRSPTRDR